MSFKGRAVIDVVNHELKLMDVTGNVNPDEVLAPERRRRYAFENDLLKLSSFDERGTVTAETHLAPRRSKRREVRVKLRSGQAIAAIVLAMAAMHGEPRRLAAAGTDITIDYDKTFSFAGLSTWAWHPQGAGDVRLALTADDDPKRVAARIEPVILPATERQLAVAQVHEGSSRTAPICGSTITPSSL